MVVFYLRPSAITYKSLTLSGGKNARSLYVIRHLKFTISINSYKKKNNNNDKVVNSCLVWSSILLVVEEYPPIYLIAIEYWCGYCYWNFSYFTSFFFMLCFITIDVLTVIHAQVICHNLCISLDIYKQEITVLPLFFNFINNQFITVTNCRNQICIIVLCSEFEKKIKKKNRL